MKSSLKVYFRLVHYRWT